jgi:hypothetical protein
LDVTAGFAAGSPSGSLPHCCSEIRFKVAEKLSLESDESASALDFNAAGAPGSVPFKPEAGNCGSPGSMNASDDIIFLSCFFH